MNKLYDLECDANLIWISFEQTMFTILNMKASSNGRTRTATWKECLHSCDQRAWFSTRTKESISIELNSQRLSSFVWGHQHGRRSFGKGHRGDRSDVT